MQARQNGDMEFRWRRLTVSFSDAFGRLRARGRVYACLANAATLGDGEERQDEVVQKSNLTYYPCVRAELSRTLPRHLI